MESALSHQSSRVERLMAESQMRMSSKPNSLSSLVRGLTTLTTLAFAIVGAILFFIPAWAAENFAWKISPMVAMTMGGWYLGTVVLVGIAVYDWLWSRVYANLAMFAAFSLLEASVLVLHTTLVRLNSAFALLYVAMLTLAVITTLVGAFDWIRLRPSIASEGKNTPRLVRVTIIGFIAFVFFLGIVGPNSDFKSNARIFPESLSQFTVDSFGAFYLSLGISAMTLLQAKQTAPIANLAKGGLALIVLITIAAFVFIGQFDFATRKGGLVYIGVYLFAGIVDVIFLWSERKQNA